MFNDDFRTFSPLDETLLLHAHTKWFTAIPTKFIVAREILYYNKGGGTHLRVSKRYKYGEKNDAYDTKKKKKNRNDSQLFHGIKLVRNKRAKRREQLCLIWTGATERAHLTTRLNNIIDSGEPYY